jgi:hypothetical protein
MFHSFTALGAAQVCCLARLTSALLGGAGKSSSVSRLALLCLLLGSGLSACKGGSPNPVVEGFAGRLPSDWPSQVPTYPDGTIETGVKLTFGDTLVKRTSDAPAKLMAFYEAQLSSLRVINSLDNGVLQSRTWSDDAQPLQVTLQLVKVDSDKTTFATLQVTHVPKAESAAATGAGQAGTAAH